MEQTINWRWFSIFCLNHWCYVVKFDYRCICGRLSFPGEKNSLPGIFIYLFQDFFHVKFEVGYIISGRNKLLKFLLQKYLFWLPGVFHLLPPAHHREVEVGFWAGYIMSIYFKNKLKLYTLSTGKCESLMHSHVCSCRELISQRGNVSESAGCSR